MKGKVLKIVSVSAEVAPFSKAGGLADVTGSLPKAIKNLGHEIIVITPLHGTINPKRCNLKLLFENVEIKIDETAARLADFWQGELKPGLPIYFIDNHKYFSSHKYIYNPRHHQYENTRYFFFNVAVFKLLSLLKFKPDIVQCHDWQMGLIPYFLKNQFKNESLFKKTASVFTIHNLSFQLGHDWWQIPPQRKDYGHEALPAFWDKKKVERVNFAKRAILSADVINAVSEQYAAEILTREFGQDLHRILWHRRKKLFGVVNGLDYFDYNPETDPGLIRNYKVDHLSPRIKNKLYLQRKFRLPKNPTTPLLAMVSRITEQKGFDLIMEVLEPLMRQELQLIIYGGGDQKYLKFFRKMKKKYPKKFAANLKFDPKDATQIYAGSDIFLMPSRFEPCGLGQLISLRYGSIPVVHAVGGLVETVTDFNPKTKKGNGFVFKKYDSYDFLIAITRALVTYKYQEVWQELVKMGMQLSYSWEIPAKKYLALFRKALKNKAQDKK